MSCGEIERAFWECEEDGESCSAIRGGEVGDLGAEGESYSL